MAKGRKKLPDNIKASAYTSISSMNNIIEVLETHDDSWAPKYARHAKALRTFVYYNLTVLWGDVPYVAAGTDVLLCT